MLRCFDTENHHPRKCLPRSLLQYGITRPQRVQHHQNLPQTALYPSFLFSLFPRFVQVTLYWVRIPRKQQPNTSPMDFTWLHYPCAKVLYTVASGTVYQIAAKSVTWYGITEVNNAKNDILITLISNICLLNSETDEFHRPSGIIICRGKGNYHTKI